MKDRIKAYMDYKGVSAGDLASLLDVQRSNISHILNGRNKPGALFIEKLLNSFPDLNARWLLTGQGNMTEDNKYNEPIQKIEKEKVAEEKQPDREKVIKAATKPKEDGSIEKVVLLYNDGSFKTYDNK